MIEKGEGQDHVTFSPEKLMELYGNFESNAKFVVDRIWESVKFFTTITSALLTISIGIYGSEKIQNSLNIDPNLKSLVFAAIPCIVIMISYIGIMNLKREYKRFLEWIVVIQKTEETLGLHKEFQTKIFSQDKYLLPDHFVNIRYNQSEAFIENGLKKKDSLYYNFKMLHIAFIVISIIISILILVGPLNLCAKGIINIFS